MPPLWPEVVVTHVSHLESALDGTRFPAGTLQTVHRDRPLWVRYDLDAVRRAVSRDDLRERGPGLWRHRELLPVRDQRHVVSLGESTTPLLRCVRLGSELGLERLWIKDEASMPTGSFKARGMAMAVSMAKELGVERVAVPTAGNAGGALAAYAARAGMRCTVLMPVDTPAINRAEATLYGARAFLVDGLIHHCGAIVREGAQRGLWFDMSTLREPYRIEGKKTMGLELAEQTDWRLPAAIFYPTGGGTGLIGMWKAFAELRALGWLADRGEALPRMYACQSSGCAPIVRAFDAGERFAAEFQAPSTIASGLRVPKAIGDFMILDAVRESGGRAIAAAEETLRGWMQQAARLEGIALCPEAATCLEALRMAVAQEWVRRDEDVVVFNTGAAQKYAEVIDAPLPRLDRQAIDWSRLE